VKEIKLVRDTIDIDDINVLIEWLKTNPRLTKGKVTKDFEAKWSKWQGRKYSVYLNSGSSANLAMIYSLLQSKLLKNKNIIVPAVSWSTTVAPAIQLGMNPILCECDKDTLGIDIEYFKKLIKEYKPSVLLLVHVLAFPNKMKEIVQLCEENNIILLEDSCESIGSEYDGIKTGNFGLMSSFSLYFGHHMSVSPDTPIPYLDNVGLFNIDNIENIYNLYKDNISEIKVLSFDEEYCTDYITPSSIIKHKINKKRILELTLENNRKVEITEDHSVFSYDKENFKLIKTGGNEVNIGDYILVPSKIRRPRLITELNFIDYCKKYTNKFFVRNYDLNDIDNFKFKWDTQENKNKFTWKKRGQLPVEYLNLQTSDLTVAIKNTPKYKYLPAKYKIDEGFCRLVGYFLAEGSYGKSSLNFSFHINEKEYIEDVRYNIKRIFGLDSSLIKDEENKSGNVKIYSETLKIFFKEYLNIKSGALNKQIPSIIYHTNDKCISSFMYGYFAGDGTNKGKNRLSVTSISKDLINGISYLFNMMGLNGSIISTIPTGGDIKGKKIKNREPQYSFVISNIILNKNGNLTISKKNKYSLPYKKLTYPISRYSKRNDNLVDYKCVDYIKLENNKELNKFIDSDLMLLKVKNIKDVVPDYDYVYDFSVPQLENFVGGYQPICLHNSTIEGGFVCTDDFDMYRILLSIRSHGWDRDLDEGFQVEKRNEYDVTDFKSLYTFYYPGFNLRATDLQAFIGLGQIDKLEEILEKRSRNFLLYDKYIKNDYWKIKNLDNCFYSNFAYPIIHPDREEIAKYLMENGVECRPLVCGSIGKQPYWKDLYGEQSFEFADKVDEYGMYLPNHPDLAEQDIKYICDLVNEKIEII